MTGAYLGQGHGEIAATLALLRWFRAFLASDRLVAHDPTRRAWSREAGPEIARPQVRARLRWLLHVAINRKAGLYDSETGGDKYYRSYRDARAANTPRLYRRGFETRQARERLLHLISEED